VGSGYLKVIHQHNDILTDIEDNHKSLKQDNGHPGTDSTTRSHQFEVAVTLHTTLRGSRPLLFNLPTDAFSTA
jgi:hypothetical protein